MREKRLGPFRIDAELGSGGMGTVYRATLEAPTSGLDTGAVVALKLLHPHLLQKPGFFKRFLREASIGQAVDHENVVRTFDCDQLVVGQDHHSFLVIEYVEGQTLRALLEDLGTVPEELCRHVGREIARGLAAIHETGVVHRDLKPENVLITPDQAVKIMDLGVARLQDEQIRLSRTGHFVGSVLYAAPEAFQGGGARVDVRADLHGLGLLLYEMATGQHPFRHDDMRVVLQRVMTETPRRAGERNPQLSPFFEEFIHTLMARKPEDRFESAAVAARILEDGEASAWWGERARAIRLATRRPLRRVRIPRETAIYGREEELAHLTELYEAAKAGQGQMVLVQGEAGVGKTRLVDEFVGLLGQEGEDPTFLFGSYPPGGAATASGAFATAYREHFGVEELETTLASYVEAAPALIPAFAALLKGEPPPTGEVWLTRDSLPTAFVHATRVLARERVVIILIDDLHFAPAEGRALFTSLAMAVPGHRILLIGTTRRRAPARWITQVEQLDHASRMVIGRLGPKDLVRLLQEAFRSERLAQSLAGRIALKSDGNPFFAFEIIRGLREGKVIRQAPDGTWVSTGAIDEITVPSSVLDLVKARVADLSREERDLLDVASCCGFEFDPLLLADVIDSPPIPLLKTLGQIERQHRLVRALGRRYVFDHHQVREALHGSLSVVLREAYHAAIAEAWEAREEAEAVDPGSVEGTLCVSLCENFLAGGRGARALRYLGPALEHLEGGYVHDQATALAKRALAVPGLLEGAPRARMLLRVNALLAPPGRREEQARVLEEARAVATTLEDRRVLGDVEGACGWLAHQMGRPEAANEHFQAGMRICRELGDRRGEVSMMGHLGIVHRVLGDFEEARAHHEHALAFARESGDRRAEGSANGSLGLVLLSLGRYEDARNHFERHLAIAREIGARSSEAKATGNLGLALRALGRYEEARIHFERRLAFAREMGDRRGECLAIGNLGLVALDLGMTEDAKQYDERGVVLSREIGDRAGEARGVGNLGLALHAMGRYEEAREHHERHLRLAREIGDREGEARALGNLGLALYALGRLEEARVHHKGNLELAHEIGHVQGETLATGNLGLTLAALGRMEEAESHVRRALAIARDSGDRQAEGYWLHALGEIALHRDDLDGARDLFDQALGVRRAIGHRSGHAETLIRLGEVAAARGDEEDASKRLGEAVAVGREIGSESIIALGLVHRALLPGGSTKEARQALSVSEGRLEHDLRMHAHLLLHRGTGDTEHLREAKRLLDLLVERVPEEARATLAAAPLPQAVQSAWEGRREAEGPGAGA